MDKVKIENSLTLERDIKTNAVLSSDRAAFIAAKARREKIINNTKKLDSLEEKIVGIENILKDILEKLK
jgi:hypothetical protein